MHLAEESAKPGERSDAQPLHRADVQELASQAISRRSCRTLGPMKRQPAVRVSGDYVQGSYALLPHAGDRARAALHFARLLGSVSATGDLQLARWYLRASLSEYRSSFDLLNKDLRQLNALEAWEQSPQKLEFEDDAIVCVMRKVRDFAVHSATIQGEPKTFRVSSPESHGPVSELSAVVIEPLSRSTPAMKREIERFDDETLSFFNVQAARWPADLLVQIAVYRSSEHLAGFLRAHVRA